jgi:carbon-monoxide dehydrogenase medium subunit
MQDFQYHRPATLAEAVSALKRADEGKYLGGGQSLIPVMKLNMAQPSDLVALSGIDALKGVARDGNAIVIGAATTHAQVAESDLVQGAIPALAQLAGAIGDPQVRNRGTLGGSLAHADPAADYPAAVLGLNATVVTDRRDIAADAFFLGLFETALEEDEIIVSVRFPIPDCAAYAKFPNPASRYAIVGVMVACKGDDVRVAVTGAGPGVFRATEMEAALSDTFSADALEGITIDPDELSSDLDASAEYRAHLVGVMARRAVAVCR